MAIYYNWRLVVDIFGLHILPSFHFGKLVEEDRSGKLYIRMECQSAFLYINTLVGVDQANPKADPRTAAGLLY